MTSSSCKIQNVSILSVAFGSNVTDDGNERPSEITYVFEKLER
jgi:hypothetical protein